jgi:hypothetical protein
MKVSICVARPRPGVWIRVIVVVAVFVLALRWAPGAAIPLGIGGWLGGWLADAPARMPRVRLMA